MTPSNNRRYKPRFFYFKEEGLNIPEYWQFHPKADRLKTKMDKYPKNRERLLILETQDGRAFREEELIKRGLSPATLPRQEVGEDKPESSRKRKIKLVSKHKGRNIGKCISILISRDVY